jgi:hypothetical protein
MISEKMPIEPTVRVLLLLAISSPALFAEYGFGWRGPGMPWILPPGAGWGCGGGIWAGPLVVQPWIPLMLPWNSGYPGWFIPPLDIPPQPEPRSLPRSERRDWGRREGWRRVGDEGDGWRRVNPRAAWRSP